MSRTPSAAANLTPWRILAVSLLAALLCAIATPSLAVTTWTGATDNVWDVATTPNWTGGTGSIYTDGDNVVFNNAGANKAINVAVPVAPGTITFNNTAGNPYSFTGSTIGGFGGTSITSNGLVNFNPAGPGAHSFGGGPITLSGSGVNFAFNPGTSGATLTNNFNINAPITWDSTGNNGVRTGIVTVNSNFFLRSDGVSPGIMEATMQLTGNRQIQGGLYFNFPRITGNIIGSSTQSLEVRHMGENPDWQYYIGSNTATAPSWDLKNLIRTSGASLTQRSGTLMFNLDERLFFDQIEANGGRVVLEGSTRFMRAAAVDVEFDMIFNENGAMNNGGTVYIGSGFRQNNKLNIKSGGLLGGNGTIRRRDDLGASPNVLPVDVEVLTGGQISPGDYTLVDKTDVLTVNGNVTFNGGKLAIDITGVNGVPGVDFDRLVVSDSTTPSGRGNLLGLSTATLEVDFNNLSFELLDGEVFDIVTSLNDLTGQSFASVTALNLADNIVFDVVYSNGLISLQNFVALVPEPSSAMLLGLGALVLVRKTRRRQRV